MNFLKISIFVVIFLAVFVNVLAFFLEKFYKKRAIKNSENEENS